RFSDSSAFFILPSASALTSSIIRLKIVKSRSSLQPCSFLSINRAAHPWCSVFGRSAYRFPLSPCYFPLLPLLANHRSHHLSHDHALNGPRRVQIKDDNWQTVFLADRNRSIVHHPYLLTQQRVGIGQTVVFLGIRVAVWVLVIDPVHLGCLEQYLCIDF